MEMFEINILKLLFADLSLNKIAILLLALEQIQFFGNKIYVVLCNKGYTSCQRLSPLIVTL